MTAADQILALVATQARTRHELHAATGLSRAALESALHRLRVRQQITAQRLEPQPPIRRPGVYGRPARPAVTYARTAVGA